MQQITLHSRLENLQLEVLAMSDTGLKAELKEIDDKIEKLKERRKSVQKRAGERVARLATEVGLLELNLTDDELRDALREVAGRFRNKPKSSGAKSEPPATDRSKVAPTSQS